MSDGEGDPGPTADLGLDEAAVAEAAAALARGEVVAYPTETFYALGVAALDPAAVGRLQTLKGRGADKALSVLVCGEVMLGRVVAEIPVLARQLMAAHWPGPLTLALPARAGLPGPLVLDGCVAVRESPHPLARALVLALGAPVTATSANLAGGPPACTAAAVRAVFAGRCFVLDGGPTPGGAASTLARVRGDRVEVLRPGPVALG